MKKLTIFYLVVLCFGSMASLGYGLMLSDTEVIEHSKNLSTDQEKTAYLLDQAEAFLNKDRFEEAQKVARYVLENFDQGQERAAEILSRAQEDITMDQEAAADLEAEIPEQVAEAANPPVNEHLFGETQEQQDMEAAAGTLEAGTDEFASVETDDTVASGEPSDMPVSTERAETATDAGAHEDEYFASTTQPFEGDAAVNMESSAQADSEMTIPGGAELITQENSDKLLNKNLIFAENVLGVDVRNDAGEHLGKVQGLAINEDSGKVEYAIIGYSGFLGFGGKNFAVSWNDLQKAEQTYRLNVSKQEVEQSAGLTDNFWRQAKQ